LLKPPSLEPVGLETGARGKVPVDIGRSVKHCMTMIKTISKIGNSHGLIFDSTLLQLARLKPGDEVNVEVHPGGTITITPMHPVQDPAEFTAKVEDVMQRYARTMKRLA
jgi:antitoxin component of MazEF toxin-antitoxin module